MDNEHGEPSPSAIQTMWEMSITCLGWERETHGRVGGALYHAFPIFPEVFESQVRFHVLCAPDCSLWCLAAVLCISIRLRARVEWMEKVYSTPASGGFETIWTTKSGVRTSGNISQHLLRRISPSHPHAWNRIVWGIRREPLNHGIEKSFRPRPCSISVGWQHTALPICTIMYSKSLVD